MTEEDFWFGDLLAYAAKIPGCTGVWHLFDGRGESAEVRMNGHLTYDGTYAKCARHLSGLSGVPLPWDAENDERGAATGISVSDIIAERDSLRDEIAYGILCGMAQGRKWEEERNKLRAELAEVRRQRPALTQAQADEIRMAVMQGITEMVASLPAAAIVNECFKGFGDCLKSLTEAPEADTDQSKLREGIQKCVDSVLAQMYREALHGKS